MANIKLQRISPCCCMCAQGYCPLLILSLVDRQIGFKDPEPSHLAARLDQDVVSINRLIASSQQHLIAAARSHAIPVIFPVSSLNDG
jgi:hypothetical protein